MDKNVRELADFMTAYCEKTRKSATGCPGSDEAGCDACMAKGLSDAGYIKPSPSEQGQEIEKGIKKALRGCPYPKDVNAPCPRNYIDKSCDDCKVKYLLLLFNSQQQKVAGEIWAEIDKVIQGRDDVLPYVWISDLKQIKAKYKE